MTNKEIVQLKYPKARAEKHKTNAIIGQKTYWLIRDGRAYMYMAEGETEAQAWKNARLKIQKLSNDNT